MVGPEQFDPVKAEHMEQSLEHLSLRERSMLER